MNSSLTNEALQLDVVDPLRGFRDAFHLPPGKRFTHEVYLVGNSLGLQPKLAAEYVNAELEKWRTLAVRAHLESDFPWMPYHEFLAPGMARLVGGFEDEVVAMNSLTANLHFMLASFYRPRDRRCKILIEAHAFPSDYIAVESHLRFYGLDPKDCLLIAQQDDQTGLIDQQQLLQLIRDHRDELALILLPGVQYYSGQLFDLESLTSVANELEIPIGLDLAHAVGNVPLRLHEWKVDFAVWCSYKYLNSGPGSVGGCFIHRRHAQDRSKTRLAGWWGHEKETRFFMRNEFRPIATAEGWQVSNPPILSLAAIRASLAVFDDAGGIEALREKSIRLTGYLERCLTSMFTDQIRIITPRDPAARGCQLSLEIDFGTIKGREVHAALEAADVRTDWREPNVIRVAPVPLYNSFEDVARLIDLLQQIDFESVR